MGAVRGAWLRRRGERVRAACRYMDAGDRMILGARALAAGLAFRKPLA